MQFAQARPNCKIASATLFQDSAISQNCQVPHCPKIVPTRAHTHSYFAHSGSHRLAHIAKLQNCKAPHCSNIVLSRASTRCYSDVLTQACLLLTHARPYLRIAKCHTCILHIAELQVQHCSKSVLLAQTRPYCRNTSTTLFQDSVHLSLHLLCNVLLAQARPYCRIASAALFQDSAHLSLHLLRNVLLAQVRPYCSPKVAYCSHRLAHIAELQVQHCSKIVLA